MTLFVRLGSVLTSLGQLVLGDRSQEISPRVNLPQISFLRNRTVSRVAIYLDSLQGYGADKVLVKITNGLAEKGIQVDLVVAKKPTQVIQELHPDIQLFDLGSSRKRVFKNVIGLSRYLSTRQPDVLFSSIHFNNVTAAAALELSEFLSGTRSRLVLRQANTLRYHLKSYPFGIGAILGFCTRLAYQKADIIISQSEGMSRDIIDFMKADPCKIRLIYNPTVTQDIFEKAQQSSGHAWVDHRDAPLILAAGRLKPQKDFTMLLQAFAKVKQTVSEARLVILGEGPQRRELEALATQLKITDSVDLPGFQRNPYAFLAMADLFVLSSRYEGLPNILIEALALGKRIVATDCESGPIEILKHGQYGTLVPVGDTDRLAEAIQTALQEPFVCLHEPQATADFQQRSQVEQYIRVFSAPLQQKEFITGVAMRWQMRLLNASLKY